MAESCETGGRFSRAGWRIDLYDDATSASSAAVFAQLHQHLLGNRLERIEDADAATGDRFKDRLVFAQQLGFQLVGGNDVRQVALVQLQHVRQLCQLVAVLLEIQFEIEEGFGIRMHALALRVSAEDDAIDAFQDQLTAGVVEDLARHRVEMKARLEAAHRAEVE